MIRSKSLFAATAILGLSFTLSVAEDKPAAEGFASLFNGQDLTGWKIPEEDNGHWKVIDGVIDYDARSEARGEKHLWSEKSYKDFIFKVDWRLKKSGFKWKVPILLADGSSKKGDDGKEETVEIEDSDSGIYV